MVGNTCGIFQLRLRLPRNGIEVTLKLSEKGGDGGRGQGKTLATLHDFLVLGRAA